MGKYRAKTPTQDAYQIGSEPWPEWFATALDDGVVLMNGKGTFYLNNRGTIIELPEGSWLVKNEFDYSRYSDNFFNEKYELVKEDAPTNIPDIPAPDPLAAMKNWNRRFMYRSWSTPTVKEKSKWSN